MHSNICFRYRLKGGHEDINKAIWYLERQLTNPEIPPSNIPREIQIKIDLFLSSEKNKYLKPVYENIIAYQFHAFIQKAFGNQLNCCNYLKMRQLPLIKNDFQIHTIFCKRKRWLEKSTESERKNNT